MQLGKTLPSLLWVYDCRFHLLLKCVIIIVEHLLDTISIICTCVPSNWFLFYLNVEGRHGSLSFMTALLLYKLDPFNNDKIFETIIKKNYKYCRWDCCVFQRYIKTVQWWSCHTDIWDILQKHLNASRKLYLWEFSCRKCSSSPTGKYRSFVNEN